MTSPVDAALYCPVPSAFGRSHRTHANPSFPSSEMQEQRGAPTPQCFIKTMSLFSPEQKLCAARAHKASFADRCTEQDSFFVFVMIFNGVGALR